MRQNPLELLSEALLSITMLPLIAMMCQVSLDVILKYLVNTPIQGTLEITAYYYMVAIVVLPLAFVEWTRQSISVDLFYQMMPRRVQTVVMALVLLLSAAGYGGLAYTSWFDALASFAKREIVMGVASIPIWPTRFLLPITFALATVVCLFYLYRLAVSKDARDQLVPIHQVDPESGAS